MKRYGIVSYNIHGNYVNYGSILQSYALQTAINRYFSGEVEIEVVDYWPDAIVGKNPLDPLKAEKNPSIEFRMMVENSMPSIRENYGKVKKFIETHYQLSKKQYSKDNFDDSLTDEQLDGYIVGSDAIWMVDFFGFDRGFWADYPSMKNSNTFAYATSFGESEFDQQHIEFLRSMINNFNAIGLRESKYYGFIRNNTSKPVQQVVDPTLLLEATDYSQIVANRCIDDPYILIYSRKYNYHMDEYADQLAKKYGYKIVEISLRAQNSDRHQMFYSAGIEEFLSLIKYAENIVTNSLHASIFATLFHRPISFFTRGNASYKVREFLQNYNLQSMIINGHEKPVIKTNIDYCLVDNNIEKNRVMSYAFIEKAL